ncbi:MAG: hypothetical protein AAB343_01450 [Patescibacteria group bacterium]
MVSHEHSDPEFEKLEAEGYPRPNTPEEALTYAADSLRRARELFDPKTMKFSNEPDAPRKARIYADSTLLSLQDAEHLNKTDAPLADNEIRAEVWQLIERLNEKEAQQQGAE